MLWSGVHGNKRLPKLLVQDLLVAYFGPRGEVVTELQLAPDKDNMETWHAEWDITLVDAKVKSPADRLKTIGWLESKGGPRGSVSAVTGSTNLARMALEAFESVGASVPPERRYSGPRPRACR